MTSIRCGALLTAALLLPVGRTLGTVYGVRGATLPAAGATSIGDPYYPALGNRGYDARHYTLDLTVDVAHDTIAGTVTITALALNTLSRFALDFAGFRISGVTVDGAAVAYSRQAHKLIISPARPIPAGSELAVTVRYSGTPTTISTPSSDGGWHDDGHEVYVASEPDGAEGWFPVNDHPLDKAGYTFRITVPRPYMVVANGLPMAVTVHGAAATYAWQERAPMASYLATVVIGSFTLQRATGPGRRRYSVTIRRPLPAKPGRPSRGCRR